ncbi:MAG: LON peptidase substrate-binding domain-containing protein [Hyphomicrobiaceae bacterium]
MSFLQNYRAPGDLPNQIPLFPLLGAILLPRANLPLNVFEPRYLAMIDDVISGDRVVGIVQPDTHGEGYAKLASAGEVSQASELESPQGKTIDLRNVGCVGRVTSYQELDDGRLSITLTGISRFRISSEIETMEPYRIASVDYTEFKNDFVEGLGEDTIDRQHLLKVLKTYLDSNHLSADWNSILRASSEFLINTLSVMSPYGAEEKQALLEADDLSERANVLVALAEMELASGGEDGGSTIQ